MRIIILQSTVLQIPYDDVDAWQIFEALLNVILLPDLLIKSIRFMDDARVLGINGDSFGSALARYTFTVFIGVVCVVVGLLPF